MTKKDYVSIALAIRKAYNKNLQNLVRSGTFQDLIDELVIVFKRDNPRFNREKFVRFINEGERTK